jgi:hypothetical protein
MVEDLDVRDRPNLGSDHRPVRAGYRIKVKKNWRRTNFNNTHLEVLNKEKEFKKEIEIIRGRYDR